MKKLTHPTTGNTVCFGRKRSTGVHPARSLREYIGSNIPTPPAAIDYSSVARPALSKMYGNDALGDCVIACQAHLVGVFTGNATGSPAIFAEPQIVSRYSAIGGYVPGDESTDNGCELGAALYSWQHEGMMPMRQPANKHKIAGWVNVNPNSIEEMMLALYLFENLDIGFDLPDAWVTPFPSADGFVWDVAGNPDPSNGHCVCGWGYSSHGVGICTWGMLGTLTWEAMAKYAASKAAGELYTAISMDSINRATQKAPTGLNFQQMLSDFQDMKG